MLKKIMLGLMLLTVTIVVGCSGSGLESASGSETTGAAVGSAEESAVKDEDVDVIKIPLNEITSTLQKYEYNANGVTVRYFAVLGSDGKVRTAFDACDVCGGYKGYRQTGNDIQCNNCGKVFSIDGLGTKNKGYGCWPSYLPHDLDSKNIIINKIDLEAGAFRFA